MKKDRKIDRYAIPFPVLYDTNVYESLVIKSFLRGKRIEKLRACKKGYFNYETNKFDIPKKDFEILQNNPRLANDLEIVRGVGFRIVEMQPSDEASK